MIYQESFKKMKLSGFSIKNSAHNNRVLGPKCRCSRTSTLPDAGARNVAEESRRNVRARGQGYKE